MVSVEILFILGAACSLVQAGSLSDIEHIVIFMQENRAFDHYYGTLRGVRGFNDHAAPLLPNGRSIFFQPTDDLNPNEYQLPYHLNTTATNAICMAAPQMGYEPDIMMWNDGKMNAWNTAREPGYGMSYFERSDLPYYYTLADNFVVGDQYFQSTFTATNPNRLHLFTGSNGLSVGKFAVLDDAESPKGWSWETMGETLEKAGVSWRVFQERDNFDDNAFAWFSNYIDAPPNSPLYEKGMARVENLEQAFRGALVNGTLPQVSWLIAPTAFSEHATNHPSDGEDLSARLLGALRDYPEIYAKTAFILNYDEGGQFFDHHWTPTAPQGPHDGKSTVTTDGERYLKSQHFSGSLPIGLGFRVPLIIVSPWTRGPFVVSEVYDHTSVIKLVEARFNVSCPNISPWRRAVTGNLLSAFDFSSPDFSWPAFPNTSNYVNTSARECADLPAPVIPTFQTFPVQEVGVRLSRPLPYAFAVTFTATSPTTLNFSLSNTGTQGAAFYLYDLVKTHSAPRKYTVEAGKALDDTLPLTPASKFGFSLHGPNGFVRQVAGTSEPSSGTTVAAPVLTLAYDLLTPALLFRLTNPSGAPLSVVLSDPTYQVTATRTWVVPAQGVSSTEWSVAATEQWYDVILTSSVYSWRVKGHLENGKTTSTDPAMGKGAPSQKEGSVPIPMPDKFLHARTQPVKGVKATLKDHEFSPIRAVDEL